jgi:uncharacterized membrane protein
MGNPIVAIILALIAYTMLNIGIVLQKKGASSLPQVEHQGLWDNIKNFVSNKIWLTGLILTSIPWFIYLFAIDYGSLSLVTPFNGWGIVVLVIFSYFYLKEPISRKELTCIGITVMGVVILGITAPETKIEYNQATMAATLAMPVSIVFILFMILLAIVPVVLSIKRKFWHADIIFGVCSGFATCFGAIFSNAMMAYIGMEDYWSSVWIALGNFAFWFYLIGAGAGNLVSMVYQQIAYQKGKASLVAPLFTIVSLVVPVIAGIVMFGEWSLVSQDLAGLRIASIIVITAGAALLSGFNKKNSQNPSKTPKSETMPENAPPPPEISTKTEVP